MIIITGGAGFIGSNFITSWLNEKPDKVINLDALTYAGNLGNLLGVDGAHRSSGQYTFVHGDIGDRDLVKDIFARNTITAVINFAAESHVDRSIATPEDFVRTNVLGTFNLLEVSGQYLRTLPSAERAAFRFLHVSTDEVYGSLSADCPPFVESHAYRPNSPYAASKAASDHLVRAYYQTYGLPVLTTNCSNNYGPYQFPEKFIPLCINNALAGEPLPIYGDGKQVRDWLYVEDHCSAIRQVLELGVPGEVYNIGGWNEKTNLEVAQRLCAILDDECPRIDRKSYREQITFIKDRPGHDRRYAIDARKIERTLGWRPKETFDTGIRKTVQWYLANASWVGDVTNGSYRNWVREQYGAT